MDPSSGEEEPRRSGEGEFIFVGLNHFGSQPRFAPCCALSWADSSEMRKILGERRMDAVCMVSLHADRIDSLTGCRRARWEHGAPPTGFELSLQELVNRQNALGGRLGASGEYWGVVCRNIGRARRRLQRSEWFRAHSMTEPRLSRAGDPFDEPSADEDPPVLHSDLDWSGGNVAGKFSGNPARQR